VSWSLALRLKSFGVGLLVKKANLAVLYPNAEKMFRQALYIVRARMLRRGSIITSISLKLLTYLQF
jgi:hypothetical protein